MKNLGELKCINSVEGLDRMGGLYEVYHELLQEFNCSEKPKLKMLKLSLLAEDWDEAMEISHDMKGIAGNLSMPICYELVSKLNDLLLNHPNLYKPEEFNEIEKVYETTFAQLDSFYDVVSS
ncbi:hypothetical protein OAA91_01470 [Fibrobacterales bacterium]|nr:hypothetical protein [Fibrobacterales bacterium]